MLADVGDEARVLRNPAAGVGGSREGIAGKVALREMQGPLASLGMAEDLLEISNWLLFRCRFQEFVSAS